MPCCYTRAVTALTIVPVSGAHTGQEHGGQIQSDIVLRLRLALQTHDSCGLNMSASISSNDKIRRCRLFPFLFPPCHLLTFWRQPNKQLLTSFCHVTYPAFCPICTSVPRSRMPPPLRLNPVLRLQENRSSPVWRRVSKCFHLPTQFLLRTFALSLSQSSPLNL